MRFVDIINWGVAALVAVVFTSYVNRQSDSESARRQIIVDAAKITESSIEQVTLLYWQLANQAPEMEPKKDEIMIALTASSQHVFGFLVAVKRCAPSLYNDALNKDARNRYRHFKTSVSDKLHNTLESTDRRTELIAVMSTSRELVSLIHEVKYHSVGAIKQRPHWLKSK